MNQNVWYTAHIQTVVGWMLYISRRSGLYPGIWRKSGPRHLKTKAAFLSCPSWALIDIVQEECSHSSVDFVLWSYTHTQGIVIFIFKLNNCLDFCTLDATPTQAFLTCLMSPILFCSVLCLQPPLLPCDIRQNSTGYKFIFTWPCFTKASLWCLNLLCKDDQNHWSTPEQPCSDNLF